MRTFHQKTAQQKEQKILKTKMQFFKKLQKLQSFDSRGWSPAMRKLGACHRLFQQKCMRRRRLDLQIERIFSFFSFFREVESWRTVQPMQSFK